MIEATFGYMMTCSTDDNSDGADFNQNGLLGLHAYSVLDVCFAKEGNSEHWMIRVRDPWGKSNWWGDFNTNSKKWTNYLKSKLSYKSLVDGEFFITYEDFIMNFNSVTICEYGGD